jgi:hypothetical protein
MKTSNKEKIDEYFSDIRTASVFQALKSQKYIGIKRSEISALLKKYTLNQVFSYLKTRYRKANYLLIYSLSLTVLILFLIGNFAYSYLYLDLNLLLKYSRIKSLSEFSIQDYLVLAVLISTILNLILVSKEIYNKFNKL